MKRKIVFVVLMVSLAFALDCAKQEQNWFEKGHYLYVSKDYKGAIAAFSKVIEQNPEHAEAYYNRAVAYNELGDHQQAIRDFKIAANLGLNPKYAKAYYNQAVALDKIGDHQLANRSFKIAANLGLKEAQDYLRKEGIEW